ncbi:hypothetical protein GUITHDRAFT_153784 [Guillardia theta CCMP2712]|uniref:Uncharacterized protein n=1 Tax=Guillardia theta (strain CCMP2712) TaxID=905079 RepID=L1IZD3_GUITC|nr:hypothetical protein GUITHDRAFT_153784 [Guillardia theta CCMP2712]EKX41606.1 hypothetical protein GUITHDRAFT_153784 [Guillardia theta CCMP2712]|eukprot:XP_005828586.1 hypothetical protein GUITHDRAFT_153784 [Guillardia theta CCMP2712]
MRSYGTAPSAPLAAAPAAARASKHLLLLPLLALAAVLLLAASRVAPVALWNAAHNDEIRLDNVGRPHPSEFAHTPVSNGNLEKKLMSEVLTHRHHVIVDPREVQQYYQPLKWIHEQGEPSARARRGAALGQRKIARQQMLWNDKILRMSPEKVNTMIASSVRSLDNQTPKTFRSKLNQKIINDIQAADH